MKLSDLFTMVEHRPDLQMDVADFMVRMVQGGDLDTTACCCCCCCF